MFPSMLARPASLAFLVVLGACGGKAGETSNDAGEEQGAMNAADATGGSDASVAADANLLDALQSSDALDAALDGDATVEAGIGDAGLDADAQAVVTSLSTESAIRIAVSAADVYWIQDQQPAVVRAALDGGSPTTLASGRQYADIVVDSTNVYWADHASSTDMSGSVLAMALGGGAISTVASAQSGPDCLAVSATNAYWKVEECLDGGTICGDSVVTAPISGGMPTTLTSSLLATPYTIWGMALDAANLYWIEADQTSASILEMPLGGGTISTLAPAASATDIAADGTNVYFTNGSALGAIMKVAVTGGQPVTLATQQPSPFGIATDGQDVYWASFGFVSASGFVAKVPIAGGTVTTLTSHRAQPLDLGLGATRVFWTQTGVGTPGGTGVFQLAPK